MQEKSISRLSKCGFGRPRKKSLMECISVVSVKNLPILKLELQRDLLQL